jgi:UDP-N-acetylglucosamine acyltransferase
MAYVHIAHDCQIGSNTVFANNAQLAGHVRVGDYATLGGFTVVHQFCRIGAHCITGMGTIVLQDIPPYITASANPARPYGINTEGLRRRGFSAEALAALKRSYKTLYRSGLSISEARAELEREALAQPEVRVLADFVAEQGRGLIR